ncbi:hypothetical protein LG943_11030 [Streptomonospora sp. S1-112]|uniref:Uncharacterized protein n=1 Tax=Streptomonospora mangrovi TaxID=2883123 RepID=A0A9X3SEE0_9ACTN|nr:hypothetical protein [Streptomonospora mangrovi]MDA0564852.1 hypothetical protein [Streptomonospora mangrovi]
MSNGETAAFLTRACQATVTRSIVHRCLTSGPGSTIVYSRHGRPDCYFHDPDETYHCREEDGVLVWGHADITNAIRDYRSLGLSMPHLLAALTKNAHEHLGHWFEVGRAVPGVEHVREFLYAAQFRHDRRGEFVTTGEGKRVIRDHLVYRTQPHITVTAAHTVVEGDLRSTRVQVYDLGAEIAALSFRDAPAEHLRPLVTKVRRYCYLT